MSTIHESDVNPVIKPKKRSSIVFGAIVSLAAGPLVSHSAISEGTFSNELLQSQSAPAEAPPTPEYEAPYSPEYGLDYLTLPQPTTPINTPPVPGYTPDGLRLPPGHPLGSPDEDILTPNGNSTPPLPIPTEHQPSAPSTHEYEAFEGKRAEPVND